ALPPLELAARFTRLGAVKEALAAGFDPAMQAGNLELALSFAQAAEDDGRVRMVLVHEAAQGASGLAEKLVEAKVAAEDSTGLWKLSLLLEEAALAPVAKAAWEALAFGALRSRTAFPDRQAALTKLLRKQDVGTVLENALEVAEAEDSA